MPLQERARNGRGYPALSHYPDWPRV